MHDSTNLLKKLLFVSFLDQFVVAYTLCFIRNSPVDWTQSEIIYAVIIIMRFINLPFSSAHNLVSSPSMIRFPRLTSNTIVTSMNQGGMLI